MEDKTCLRSCKTTRRWPNTTFNITEINQYLNDLVHEYRHVDFTNTFLEKKYLYKYEPNFHPPTIRWSHCFKSELMLLLQKNILPYSILV